MVLCLEVHVHLLVGAFTALAERTREEACVAQIVKIHAPEDSLEAFGVDVLHVLLFKVLQVPSLLSFVWDLFDVKFIKNGSLDGPFEFPIGRRREGVMNLHKTRALWYNSVPQLFIAQISKNARLFLPQLREGWPRSDNRHAEVERHMQASDALNHLEGRTWFVESDSTSGGG